MLALLAAAMLHAPSIAVPVSDAQAQRLSNACVAAAARDLGELRPAQVILRSMVARREAGDWRIDYDVTVLDRSGRPHQWNGDCTVAAPHVQIIASN